MNITVFCGASAGNKSIYRERQLNLASGSLSAILTWSMAVAIMV